MNSEPAKKPLIVVALDAAERGEYVIELARTLARTDSPELLGVFVEDSALLAHAGSHLAREILLSGAERELERSVLERQLRSQASLAKARFEAASARLGLSHRFEVTRGDIFSEPVERAAAAEALIVSVAQIFADSVSLAGLFRRSAGCPPLVLLARRGWLTGRSIAVLVDDASAGSHRALHAAARIAARSRAPISVLIAMEREADCAAIAEQAALLCKPYGIGAFGTIVMGGKDAADLLQAARACQAKLLVLPASASLVSSDPAIDSLVRRFSGAVMLVRD